MPAIFDGVVGVVEDAVQTLVEMWDVVAAVEIVVDVDFPVAVEGVLLAGMEVQAGEVEGGYPFYQVVEEAGEWLWGWIQVDEEEVFPGIDGDGDEAVGGRDRSYRRR